ncbi:uncharacterized protein LOC117643315 [Thrips palmi]|uniref:Uncharacterized protein LOC117643315 n=1 Tax=Thrips palmi TaxID=161013 RepID=A0A6P8YMI3_THRPL|nr:uncharacterized protein LOC117643315 [Thrips palmi]
MARVLFLFLALVAAASATQSRYTVAQLVDLFGRIDACLAHVPQTGFSNQPSDVCKDYARKELMGGYTKESQVDRITNCLKNYEVPVAADDVAFAEECLNVYMPMPVTA